MPLPPGFSWSSNNWNEYEPPSREEIDIEKQAPPIDEKWDWQNEDGLGPQGQQLPELAIGWRPDGNADFGTGLQGWYNKAMSNVRASWMEGYQNGLQISGITEFAVKKIQGEEKGTETLEGMEAARKPENENAAYWSAATEASKEIFNQALWGVLEGLSQPAMWAEQALGTAGHSIDRAIAGEEITKETLSRDWQASRLAYSQMFDATIYEEMNRRLDSGMRADLAAQDVMVQNPGTLWPELIGQIVLDPLNVISVWGKAGQQIKMSKNAQKAFTEVTNPAVLKMLDNVDELAKMDDAKAYQQIDELIKSQQNLETVYSHAEDIAQAGKDLETFSSSYKLSSLTRDGKIAHIANQTSEILMHVVNNSAPDEALEILRGMVKSASKNPDEAAEGLSTMMHFANPKALFSEAGNKTTVMLSRMAQKYGDNWLDDIDALKGNPSELTKALLTKLDDVGEEMFPSVSSMLKAADDIKNAVPLTDTAAIARRQALADRAAQLPKYVRDATRFHDAAQKVVGPVNKFYIGAFMGWSPGFAFRNYSNNSLQLLIDYGPGILLGDVNAAWDKLGRMDIGGAVQSLLQGADTTFAQVEKLHGGTILGVAEDTMEASLFKQQGSAVKAYLGSQQPTNVKAGIEAAKAKGLKGPVLGASQAFEANAAKRIIAKTYRQTFDKGVTALTKALTPQLKAAGFSDDIIRKLPTYILQNDGDAVKVINALREEIATGTIDLFNDVSRIDPKYKSFLSDVGKWDEYAENVLRAPTREAASEAAKKIFDDIAQAGDYVYREGRPAVGVDDQFLKMAEQTGLPENRGQLISLRTTESRKAIEAAESILKEADDLGAKLGLDVGTMKKARGIQEITGWGSEAAKEATRIRELAWKITRESRKPTANLTALWKTFTADPMPANVNAATFRDALWAKFDNVMSSNWSGARDVAIDNVGRYLDDLKAAGAEIPDQWREVIKTAQEGAQQYDNAMVGRFGELVEEAPLPYGTRSSQIAELANKYGIPTATGEAANAADNIKSWFGSSKVVDEAGEPLTVYHGTNADFSEFKTSEIGKGTDPGYYGEGFYFSVDKEIAASHGSSVKPFYLKIENPLNIRNRAELYDAIGKPEWKARELFNKVDPERAKEITRILKEKGYDGVVVQAKGEDGVLGQINEIMTFDPKQIKTAAPAATKAAKTAGAPLDKKTLSLINKYAETTYKSLEEVPLSVAEEAFKAKTVKATKAAKTAQPELAPAGVTMDEAVKIPRGELPPEVSTRFEQEANRMMDELNSGTGPQISQPRQGEGGATVNIPSTNVDWYRELPKSLQNKKTLNAALEKIIKDKGSDKGVNVERLKEMIIDRFRYGSDGAPPDLKVLKGLGADEKTLQSALDDYNDFTKQELTLDEVLGEAVDQTDELRNPDLPYFDDAGNLVEPTRTAKRILPPPTDGELPPISRAIHEQMDKVKEMRGWMMDDIAKNYGKKQVTDKVAETALKGAERELSQKLAETKLISSRVAQANRDFTLLNYGEKSYWDVGLAYLYPFHFWYKGTYKNWLSRAVTNPAILGHYSRYKQHLGTVHADMPEWWKYNVNTNDLPGIDVENPLYFNLEATLWPLNGITGMDFNDRSKVTNWWTHYLDFANKFGPSTWTPISMMTGLALYNKGETEAGLKWMGRAIPQSATIKAVASKFGVGNLEVDPIVKLFGENDLDPYEQRRVSRALAAMEQEAIRGDLPYTQEEIQDAAYNQSGDIWDEAVKRAVNGRSGSQISSFLFGVGFKGRTNEDKEVDQFYSDYSRMWTMRPNLSPDEFREGMDALKQKYPFADSMMLSGKDGAQRDSGLAYLVMSRIPPGQSAQIAEAAGISDELLNRFYDSKGMLEDWSPADRQKFMGGILAMSAVMEIPDDMTRGEWSDAKGAYGKMNDEAKQKFGEDILDQVDGYYAAKTQSPDAGTAFLDDHPDVAQFMDWKTQRVMDSPLLSAYYGGASQIEGYYRSQMYGAIEKELGKEIFDVVDEYNTLKTFGGSGESKAFYNQHRAEIKKYYQLKDDWNMVITRETAKLAAQLPEAQGAGIREDYDSTSPTQQNLATSLQGEEAPTFEDFAAVIPENTMALVVDYFRDGEPLSESAQKQLDRIARDMGYEYSDDLLQAVGISLYEAQQ